jgi:formylglycine-generating enzyme required for sulfatase activity
MKTGKYLKVFAFMFISIMFLAASCQAQGSGLKVDARNLRADPTPTVTPPPVANFRIPDPAGPIPSGPLPSDGGELIFIPAGDFVMGSPFLSPNAEEDEYPRHTVHLDGFWIHKNEVTNEMYSDCVLEGPCTGPDIEEGLFETHPYNDPLMTKHPVTDVEWIQAATYCEWINGRLPTEAEWEKTARGAQPLVYPWGGFEPTCELADSEGCEEGTSEIGTHVPGQSPLEALDMAGNVREWVYDLYSPDYYRMSYYHNPPGPRDGENRVARGGGWQDGSADIRTANRFELDPESTEGDLGFRCVVLSESAPMCQNSYKPLCAPGSPGSPGFEPGRPGGSCTPGGGLDPEQISVEFGCIGPSVQQINLNLRSELTSTEDVQLNGQDYDCESNDDYPGRLFCSGPSANQGQDNAVTVCREGCAPNPCPQSYTYDTGMETCIPPSGGNGNECGENAFFDTGTETCQPLEPSGNDGGGYGDCAEGFIYDTGMEQCYPDPGDGNNNGCPEGTIFDTSSERCVSDGNDCFSGFYFDPYTEQCQPSTFTNDSCPLGSYYNPVVKCCVPYGNEQGCSDGFAFDTRVGYCVPGNEGGECPKGYYFDTMDEACRSSGDGDTQCPPDHFFDTGLESCQPLRSEYGDPGRDCPDGSYVDQYTGICTPGHTSTGQDDCGDGYYLDTNSERCLSTQNGCPIGTYFDTYREQCIPTTGLTSGCPSGSYYNDWFACCAPSNDFGRQGCQEGFFYDTGLGYCAPPPNQNGDCGEGFYLDTLTERCMSTGDNGDSTPCPSGQVFDTGLGYCSPPPNENGDCGDGFTFDTSMERCVSDGGSNEGCPRGSYFDTGMEQCVPGTSGGDDGSSCVTLVFEVPYCATPTPVTCERGYIYNTSQGECVERTPDDPPEDDDGACQPACINGYFDTSTNSFVCTQWSSCP